MIELSALIRMLYEDLAAIDEVCDGDADEANSAELEDTIFYLEETEPEGDELMGTLDDMLVLLEAFSPACAQSAGRMKAHLTLFRNNL